jgi:death-on-curing protein
MSAPLFLTLDEVLDIHRDQIALNGGLEGIRDLGLLKSALAMPQAGARGRFFHADVYEMGAAYLFHIVGNHPFLDGNKRTAFMAAYVFLRLNGIDLIAADRQATALVMDLSAGKASKADAAEFFKKHAK